MPEKNDFDKLARWYDLLVWLVFGKSLQAAQCEFLDRIGENTRVLIIGGGTGWILESLLEVRPNVKVDYVEKSRKMLEKTQIRVTEPGTVCFIHGTEKNVPGEDYDCIITNFFLDVFSEEYLPEVIDLLRQKLAPEGAWICTDFRQTGKKRHRLLIWLMHRFFRIFSRLSSRQLNDINQQLELSGLVKKDEKRWRNGLVFSAVYQHSGLI